MEIRILQYNTHLFLGTVPGGFPGTTYQDAERRDRIIEKLARLPVDLVALEEVWGDRDGKQRIMDRLAGDSQFFFAVKDSVDTPFAMGSGLLLLSRQPLVYDMVDRQRVPLFTTFREAVWPDSLANKGFLTVQVKPIGGPPFWVVHTHTQADYTPNAIRARTANLGQISEMVDRLHSSFQQPVVVVGDLNVVAETKAGEPTPEYRGLGERVRPMGLEDSFRLAHPQFSANPGFTYDGTRNRLIGIFAAADKQEQQRLDYVFVDSSRGVRTIDAAVVSDFTYEASGTGGKMDLSDHYPVSVGFSIGRD